MTRRSAAGVLALSLTIAALVAPATAAPDAGAATGVVDTGDTLVVSGDTYDLRIVKGGFRYSFADRSGAEIVPAHHESGIRFLPQGESQFADAVDAELISRPNARTAIIKVTLEGGSRITVNVRPFDSHARISVGNLPGEGGTIDFRTGYVAPGYGLGDHGSWADGSDEQGESCNSRVRSRPTTELTGLVLEDVTNGGSCQRFISNFTVFPKQRFGQVLFEDGQKRFGLTDTENRLGAAGVDRVDGLYYFVGRDLKEVYADYRHVRAEHGYYDGRPNQEFFGLGWEAFGALRWDTYQSSVTETVQRFLDEGYPLSWGVVGSGFWPGERSTPEEGTTNSFGMWDDTAEVGRDDGLPNPRYPDPDALKQFFADNEVKLILGARNNFKALPEDGGNFVEKYDGPFVHEAIDRGYLVSDADGAPTVITKAVFPSGHSYVLDGSNGEAVDWFVEQLQKWGVDGWKEDAMLYTPRLHRDANWNPVLRAMHEAGDLVMARNAAYSLPGDILRINDTIYGTGENYHTDPDRMPINLLNYAASGVSSLYGDYVGGTPEVPMSDPSYQKYYVRNAQFNALQPVMAFGRGPWEMGRDDYARAVKDVALWHESMRPYIYDAALDGHETGFPYAMTPLPLAYPDDENTYQLANDTTRQYEWMLGESVLATPVFGADFGTAQSRDVYLPAGKWIDIATGSVFNGPTTLEDYVIGYDRVPAFVGGKGVTVTGADDHLQAQVYPIQTGSSYDFSDGEDTTRIRNDNTGWDTESLSITDTSTRGVVEFDVDPVTGALSFPITPGHDYRLSGGGAAEHTVPLDTEPPEQVTGLSHAEADGLTTLRWDAAVGARSYVVSVSGHGACPSDEEVVFGATTGAVELTLGAADSVGGTYRVHAVNNAGTGPFSEGYTVVAPDDEPGPVIVTNEGEPPTCNPEKPAYHETGTWSPSAVRGFDESRTRFSRDIGATATWRASLTPGAYDVAVWFPENSICSDDTTYAVHHAGGSTDVPVDQCATGGQWHSLGTYDFTAAYAEVTLTVGGGTVRADAVRFSHSPE
ncbi:hypothetical protein E1269_02835 [Jiangella asiatica]|uniref:DUF5110 domain-containing protein n=2 Tax=Jiangella asiatica TaxID=2530372 RepID=A0A4R5DSQ8_9ACTN|nr:hypothetical protein E1269_02835 [Jiangella asiatica]